MLRGKILITKKKEHLYYDVPPTKLRNKEEKFKPAQTNNFWRFVGDYVFFNMLQNRFYAFRYRNVASYTERDEKYPTIMFSPHSNWWDGIVFYNIVRRICKKELRIMVEELNRFPILRHAGAFSVCKKSAQTAMKALKYSIETIGDLNNILCIFPQGIIRPPHFRPFEFQTGLAYIAENAVKKYGKVNLIPVSFEYCFLRDNRPEVLVEFGKRIELTNSAIDRKELTHGFESALTEVCDHQFGEIANGNFDEYEILFKQKLKWYRRIEQRLKNSDLPEDAQFG